MKRLVYKWHRKLAWVLALPMTLWMLTGVLHPMMSNWFKPDIAHKFLPKKAIPVDSSGQSIGSLFSDLDKIHTIKMIQIGGRPVIMGITPEQKLLYRDPSSGKTIENAEQQYVELLARSYMDDFHSPLLSIRKVEEFGGSYSYISRFLPVYRVVLDRADGLQVVIDPRTGKLAAYDNSFRRIGSKLFTWFHTWSFLGPRESLFRIFIVTLMSGLGFLISLTGAVNLWTMRKSKTKKTRRYHYWLGAVTTLLFFMFSLSGLFHSVIKFDYDNSTQWVSKQAAEVNGLNYSPKEISEKIGPYKALSLAKISGQAYYRVVKAGRDGDIFMLHTENLNLLENGELEYAKQLALEFSGYQPVAIKEVEKISKFRDDYGFIFRRLPVWRVSFKDQEYWNYTVDTQDSHMAMRTKPLAVIEAISFVNLHKFHFLDPLGKSTRDWVLLASMTLTLSTVVSGIWILIKRKKSRKNNENT